MEPNNSKYMDAARDALNVQSASNLSGIFLSMVRHVETLNVRKRLIGRGTDWFNTHPIMYLFSAQIGYLTGTAVVCDDTKYTYLVENSHDTVHKRRENESSIRTHLRGNCIFG